MNEIARFPDYSAQPSSKMDDLPHSIEAEQNVLGALLCDNALLDRIVGVLEVEHFFEPVHARIFQTISACIARFRLASPVTLKAIFTADQGLKDLGGDAYLIRLAGAAVAANQIVHYAQHVVELSERRRLLELTSASADSLRNGAEAAEVVERLEAELLKSSASNFVPRSMSLLAAATKAISEMNERYQNGSTGVPSGIPALDKITGGFHRAEFTIIGGATSMGKTAVGTWIAHAAAKQGVGVGFATLEMGESQLYQRINAIDSRVPYQDQRCDLTEETFRRVVETSQNQKELPIELFNSETRTIHGVFAEARKLQRKWSAVSDVKGLGMLVIDYIQLVKGRGTPLEVLAEAATECKNIAKRLDIPVIALAQVNRTIGHRDNKVPTLADLRGSGDLEFAADTVIFCHRPEYYLTRELQNSSMGIEQRADIEASLSACRNKMDLYVAKHRMGPINHCRLGCHMATNRFWNLESD